MLHGAPACHTLQAEGKGMEMGQHYKGKDSFSRSVGLVFVKIIQLRELRVRQLVVPSAIPIKDVQSPET